MKNFRISVLVWYIVSAFTVSCVSRTVEKDATKMSTATPIDSSEASRHENIITGADQTEAYLPLLTNKRVAVLANPTTVIGERHLVDSLLSRGVNIVKVFGPEHGFRGNASNGATVADEKDPEAGISIISLYGKKKETF